MLKEPCPYHQGPVKHTLEECVMLQRHFHRTGTPAEGGRAHNNDKKEDHKAEEFPEVHYCFMIYGGQVANALARHHKRERREVCSVKVAVPVYLDWSDKPITFDQGDHPDRVLSPGKYPLIVHPVIGNIRLTKVLMDGGSSLNIIYAETLELLQIDLSSIWAGAVPFHGIIPGKRVQPLGQLDLPICFGTPSNFRKETLTFEVVGFRGTYHAVLGRPCYAKFMVVPNYTYLKLKMTGPNGVIIVGSTYRHVYECDVECVEYAKALTESESLIADLESLSKEAPDAKRHASNFKPAEMVKSVPLDPKEALGNLKALLTSTPILVPPAVGEALLIYVAATTQVVSAAIMVERREEGHALPVQRPVYFISEVLSETKNRYPQIQKLLYTVILTRQKL
jgi:hypothetical protein